jgi:hypothetical protein
MAQRATHHPLVQNCQRILLNAQMATATQTRMNTITQMFIYARAVGGLAAG